MEPSNPRRTVGCMSAALGATIATGGTFLELVRVTIRVDGHPLTLHSSYVSTDRGKLVATIGVAVLVLALATVVRGTDGVRFAFACGLGGVAVLAVAIYDWIDVRDFVDRRVGASAGPALAVCAAGGAIVLVGALSTLRYAPRAARRARRQTSP